MQTDPHRFIQLYEPVARAARAWAELRCKGPLGRALDAEDLVQEVCLEAMGAIERYDPELGPFRAWFFGVANLVVNNLLRRLARGRLLPGDVSLASREDRVPAAITTLTRRVRRDEAMDGFFTQLDNLKEDERRMVILRGLEGLDHSAVGEILGLGADVAAKRWQRLRDRIQTWPSAERLLHDI